MVWNINTRISENNFTCLTTEAVRLRDGHTLLQYLITFQTKGKKS